MRSLTITFILVTSILVGVMGLVFNEILALPTIIITLLKLLVIVSVFGLWAFMMTFTRLRCKSI
jgi:hypothetical protein